MKRKFLTSALIAIMLSSVVLALAACGSSNSSIEGRWTFEGVVLEFNSGGRGTETFDGMEFDFTWSISGDVLGMDFPGNPAESPINYILNLEMHGAPVGQFMFSVLDDGQILRLSDDHGHAHFIFDFERIN